jgi:hypothetical protein
MSAGVALPNVFWSTCEQSFAAVKSAYNASIERLLGGSTGALNYMSWPHASSDDGWTA